MKDEGPILFIEDVPDMISSSSAVLLAPNIGLFHKRTHFHDDGLQGWDMVQAEFSLAVKKLA